MPEGHILHRLASEINATVGGVAVSSSSPQGRFTAASGLNNLTVGHAWARGKHLFVPFNEIDHQVHVHLGLYGAFTLTAANDVPVTGQVRWRVESPGHTIDLRGPSRCELIEPSAIDAIVARLGPDALDPDAQPELAWQRINRSSQPIAHLLMEQHIISGVGNVYRAEVLFRQKIDPFLPGSALSKSDFEAVWADLVELMAYGKLHGRIDTVRPEHEPEAMGREPRDDDHGGEVYVYRRQHQPCLVCENPVKNKVLAARNLFWCQECQTAD
ncbi:MAG: Fpg/Nei family DNA glycosylase [Aeromicrobium sp.]|nr:MAG: Fpg/Nei family DNA glycosylase [Aeromicrobium sp.]